MPCLKTLQNYIFIVSTDDIDKAPEDMQFHRFLMPYERRPLLNPKHPLQKLSFLNWLYRDLCNN